MLIRPTPKVTCKLPAPARNFIFLRTSSIFRPNSTEIIERNNISTPEIT